jgi:hypothetical protein
MRTGLLSLGHKVLHEATHALHGGLILTIQQVMPLIVRTNKAGHRVSRLLPCRYRLKLSRAHGTDHLYSCLVLSKRFGSRKGARIESLLHHHHPHRISDWGRWVTQFQGQNNRTAPR